MTNDLAKPTELFPEIYQDWGDDVGFSLQLDAESAPANESGPWSASQGPLLSTRIS